MSKNFVAKPLIKKLYETRKKWLGTKSNSGTAESANCTTAVNGVCDNKLKIVIENFDKILDEFGSDEVDKCGTNVVPVDVVEVEATPPAVVPRKNKKKKLEEVKKTEVIQVETKIPKLVKSKTCSIIESKCILKKGVLNQRNLTKSMDDIDKNEVHFDRSALVIPNFESKIQKNSKVKEIVEKIENIENAEKKLVKTKSFSKIPIKTNLKKSFPSTPCLLHKVENNCSKKQENINLKKSTISKSNINISKSKNVNSTSDISKKNIKNVEKSPKKITTTKSKIDNSISTTKNLIQKVDKINEKLKNHDVKNAKNISKKIDTSKNKKISPQIQNKTDIKLSEKNTKLPPKLPNSPSKKQSKFDYNSDDSGNISNETELEDYSNNIINKEKAKEISEVFFRNGILPQLESQRDDILVNTVTSLQAVCRGYVARKRLKQKKLQVTAARCIQRNVRKFMLVRDWPWWRLLVRVTPLLDVHRTEEDLKKKTEELEILRQKFEKLEIERNGLKYENEKLENKLSEMTADLAEEHSSATLAGERLEAETSERLRLEKELNESQSKNKALQQNSEKLEMELIYAKSDLNGIAEEEEDLDNDGVYKQRYERAIRELEFTKRRLQQQHEDDLEQLIGLKKQLEKKLADAYEEVEEQRQVVGTWKRKVQKLNGEMNDLKLLLEEQSSRNNLLEKKQRKFDSETQLLQDELKKERQIRDRLSREKEVLISEKYGLESSLADTRLELDLKEEKLNSLQREFDEVTCSGKTEEEVTLLRKQKIDCERRLQDQEEELDELAGQVQLLEQAKLRLEMTLESMRKDSKKETAMRDEEIEEIRGNAQKKVKALEQQLENEHEERTILLREKHELERRLQQILENDRQDKAGDEALLHRLKRDLKKTKILLRDTQAQLDRQKNENTGKNTIRQLRNQLEDLECARAIAVKTKQALEGELVETQALLDESHKNRQELEEKVNNLSREKSDLVCQIEENEEEMSEVMKKYKMAVQQMSLDQAALQEQVSLVSDLEIEKNQLKERLVELTNKLENIESGVDVSSNILVRRSELKVKELENRLELEQTSRQRLETQISRLKESVEKLQNELVTVRSKDQSGQDAARKLQRNLRELKEELNKSLAKESEAIIKKKEAEKRCETLENECSTLRADLRLALKRIEDLQSAIQGEIDSISDHSESENDTYSSDDSVNTFLSNHKSDFSKNSTAGLESTTRRLSQTSRSSTSGSIGKDSSYA